MLHKSLWVIEDKRIHDEITKYSNNTRKYRKGSLIYQQEDARDNLYFLLKGRVRVSISNYKGSEKILAVHEPGSFFGETAFFDNLPSFSNAEALIDSTIVIISKEDISTIMSQDPELTFHIFESMCRKIRLLTYQVEYLSFFKIEERIVSLLITLFLSFGIKCSYKDKVCNVVNNHKNCYSEGYVLDLTITDQEIGDMIGARREAVTKGISNLRQLGLIKKNKRIICCPNLQKLKDFLSAIESN